MDRRDMQIMEIMAQNCRIPNKVIAKALKTSKDTVSYRIKQLEKEGFLNQYVLFVDARVLGFTRYHLLLRFEEGMPDSALIKKLSEHPFVMWINTFIGRFDIQIIVDAADGFHLDKIREELFKLCRNKIKEYTILTHLSDFQFTQINPLLELKTNFSRKLDHSFSSISTTKNFPVEKEFNRYQPSESEIKILKELADDPKISLIDIGRKLKIDRLTVKKKIINLINKKVILNFGGIPNLSKLGFVTYYLLVRLVQGIPLEIRKKPFLKLGNIFYAGNMIGDYDMILYLNARDPSELNNSIQLFRGEIEKYIINYELLVQDKVHYWKQFSPGIYDYLLKKAASK